MTVLNLHQLKAQVRTIRAKCPHAKAIAIQTPHQWTGESDYDDEGLTIHIVQCRSPLAIRLALQTSHHNHSITVILTDCESHHLDEDILTRIAKRRLFTIDPWQSVKERFGAQLLDPRLQTYPWLADYLLSDLSNHTYRVPAGVLDAETVWSLVLKRELTLKEERPDLQSLLEWSLTPGAIARYQHSESRLKTLMQNCLVDTAGPTAQYLLTYLDCCEQPQPVAMGIVLDVLFHPETRGKCDRAIGKLEERYFNGQTLDAATLQPWREATAHLIRQPLERFTAIQLHADELLQELGVEAYAHVSPLSQTGFDQRLSQWAEQFDHLLQAHTHPWIDTHDLEFQDLYTQFQRIVQSPAYQPTSPLAIRLTMAMRLGQWLHHTRKTPPSQPPSFEAAVQQELALGCWLDRARFALAGASDRPRLAQTYTKLFQTITHHREQAAEQFADYLVQATANHNLGHRIIPVEQILNRVLAPIAAQQPILLIVMDGMSLSIAITLAEELSRSDSDWQLLQPKSANTPMAMGLATIPSDTKTSRSSLFGGQLCQGNADQETKAFAKSAELTQRRRGRKPPILFHKMDLRDAAHVNLAPTVEAAIQDPKQAVVAVVVNAIDDHLDTGEQTRLSWSVEEITPLAALLRAAQDSKRIVCLTSDHGHVLDHAARYEAPSGGERWRAAQGAVNDYERKITGDRVLGTPNHTLIAPWTETVRYTKKKHGYHGGINPQEMLVAIVLFGSSLHSNLPNDYQPHHLEFPDWWHLQ